MSGIKKNSKLGSLPDPIHRPQTIAGGVLCLCLCLPCPLCLSLALSLSLCAPCHITVGWGWTMTWTWAMTWAVLVKRQASSVKRRAPEICEVGARHYSHRAIPAARRAFDSMVRAVVCWPGE